MLPRTRVDSVELGGETLDPTAPTKAYVIMVGLTTDILAEACRIFLSLAYPDGLERIPEDKLVYLDLPPNQLLSEYHANFPLPASTFRLLHDNNGDEAGVELRLGRKGFPHLKMNVRRVDNFPDGMWVFSVNTHDKFSDEHYLPPPDHPEADAWREMQETNARYKAAIETAWEAAGFLTFKAVLRLGLDEEG
ncbi:MAG: hypothetical protein ACFCD0_18225 [Gemmataceae bacterium]